VILCAGLSCSVVALFRMNVLEEVVAVIPCAGPGRGTWSGLEARGGDSMLPIAGKPAIVWTIQALLKLGLR
jgi:hypothetical protein